MKLLSAAVANFIVRWLAGESGPIVRSGSRWEPMPLPANYSEGSTLRDEADAVGDDIPEVA
jgi:hypothetical protein